MPPTTQSRRRITWEKLGERTRLMLQRLNDCILLDEDDLCALVWPEAVSRQARAERLSRWQAEQYIQPIAAPGGRCYQLGRSGARLLREAGFPRIAPVRPVAERVRPGASAGQSVRRLAPRGRPPAGAARRQLARPLGPDCLAAGHAHDLPLDNR